jgi:uncharacterized protein YabE (DUF348 family)
MVRNYYLTTAPDVKSALGEVQIKLGEKDRVRPGLDTAITGKQRMQ